MRACGSCHCSEGTGGPENANLAGLLVAYFVQQIADFKSGARKSSGPERSGGSLMAAAAKAMTDAEMHAAAEYLSALKPKRIIKVAESDSVPKTYNHGSVLTALCAVVLLPWGPNPADACL